MVSSGLTAELIGSNTTTTGHLLNQLISSPDHIFHLAGWGQSSSVSSSLVIFVLQNLHHYYYSHMNNIGLPLLGTTLTSILLVLSALFCEVAVGQNEFINEATLAVTTISPSGGDGVNSDAAAGVGVIVDTTIVPTLFPTTLSPTTFSPTTIPPTFVPTFSPTESITILNTMNPTQQATTDSPTAAATTGNPTEESMPPTLSTYPTVPIPVFPPDEFADTRIYNCSSTFVLESHDDETCNQYKDIHMISGHKDDECVCYYFCSDTGTPESSGGYVHCLERGEVKEFGCSGGASIVSCLDKTKLEEEIETSDATPTIDSIKEALDSLYYTAAVALGAIICAF